MSVPSRNFCDGPLEVISTCVSILINVCFRFVWGRYSITKHFPHFQYVASLRKIETEYSAHIISQPNKKQKEDQQDS